MLRLGREREALRVVDDQLGAPSWSRLLAEATALGLARAGDDLGDVRGIYHLSTGGQTSWCGFARSIFEALHLCLQDRFVP